jgi:hypothetical protein
MTCHACRTGSGQEDTPAAEAYIVVRVRRIVVVPIGNGAVVGIIQGTVSSHFT